MSEQLPVPPPGFDALSVPEQIDYVQSLWDHIAARPERVPVPDWHREILEQRLESYRSGASEGRAWKDFEKELRIDLDKRIK